MRHNFLLPTLLFVLCAAITSVQAQTELTKFGKLELKEYDDRNFAADTAAEAVIMSDFGRSHFEYQQNGFVVVFEHITRLKILKKAGYDRATVQVPLFRQGQNAEKLSGLRGYTYNLVGGQLVKEKLESSSMFSEQTDATRTLRKFTMPHVMEGSVIEYTYTITSDFLYNFQDWQFQYDIPVRHSEYRVSMPEYFDYRHSIQGYVPLAVNEQTESTSQFMVMQHGPTGSGVNRAENVRAQTKNYRWVMKDVPAFRSEPFMTSIQDYVARINFELQGVRFPQQAYENLSATWKKVNMSLLADENFGQQVGRIGFLKSEVTTIMAATSEPLARAAALHQVVKNAVQFNGKDRLYTTIGSRKAYEQHSGNCAEINLLLVGLLREAGLQADPLILSTRDHGSIGDAQPSLSRFNYVLAAVRLPNQENLLLLDATDRNADFGMLPLRCLNVLGHVVSEDSKAPSNLVVVSSPQRYVHYQTCQLTLDEQGNLKGKLHDEHAGYRGLLARAKLQSLGEKKYIETAYLQQNEGFSIPKYSLQQVDMPAKPLAVDLELEIASESQAGGTLFFSPLRGFGEKENPFRAQERQFPVDFGAPVEETVVMNVTLPPNYEIDELPKNAVIMLAENGGRFQYMIVPNATGLQIVSRFSLAHPSYSPEEYTGLRDFYKYIVAKHAERIVLKKKS